MAKHRRRGKVDPRDSNRGLKRLKSQRSDERAAAGDDPIEDYIAEYGDPDWWSALSMGWGNR